MRIKTTVTQVIVVSAIGLGLLRRVETVSYAPVGDLELGLEPHLISKTYAASADGGSITVSVELEDGDVQCNPTAHLVGHFNAVPAAEG